MKTTLEISDDLFRDAKAFAARQGATLRRVHERALREFLQRQEQQEQKPFLLKDASVKGNGLQQGVDLSDQNQRDELLYPTQSSHGA